jgi:TalC/MipB family fructose-6-phosphate aldolase
MTELMLDTANMDELKFGFSTYPISGVTSNPTILKKEGNIDVYTRLAEIKKLCGKDKSLHVQVVSTELNAILEEARFILDKVGKDTYIKIPASEAGLPVIKILAAEGVNVTATAIYSTMQGILAVLAGAKYIAIYYNRMEDNNIDPQTVVTEIHQFIEINGLNAKILAASFKNVSQVVNAITSGSQSVTVPLSILTSALGMANISRAVKDFKKDFEIIHGVGSTMLTI